MSDNMILRSLYLSPELDLRLRRHASDAHLMKGELTRQILVAFTDILDNASGENPLTKEDIMMLLSKVSTYDATSITDG